MAYLVVDASGGSAVVEGTPRGVAVRRARDGFVAATNHAVEQEDDSGRTARSRQRYDYVLETLQGAERPIGVALVKELLREHQHGICAGPHGGGLEAGRGTIWSSILRPDLLRMEIAPGRSGRSRTAW